MRTVTMVAKLVDGNGKIVGLTLIDNEYKIINATLKDVSRMIRDDNIELTNVKIGKDGITSTNGDLSKYTVVSTDGRIIGRPRPVILSRVESNGKLVGYIVFSKNGQVTKMHVEDAVEMYKAYGISNGKIRSTSNGDIISSIKGNFPLAEVELSKAKAGKTDVRIVFFCNAKENKADSKGVRYLGALISGDSIAELSKIHREIGIPNSRVMAEVSKFSGEKQVEALRTQRVGATEFYSVFNIEFLREMAKAGYNISMQLDEIEVSELVFENKEIVSENTAKFKLVDGKAVFKMGQADSNDTKGIKELAVEAANIYKECSAK